MFELFVFGLMLGSRFKRTVVPLGLMSAAAAVCYPAQAVAALKVILPLNTGLVPTPHTHRWSTTVFPPQVTGKKVYSAGRWSSAAVSSLFVPKPQEAVAGHPTPLLPQVFISRPFISHFSIKRWHCLTRCLSTVKCVTLLLLWFQQTNSRTTSLLSSSVVFSLTATALKII